MSSFDQSEKLFKKYNPLIFDLKKNMDNNNILDTTADVKLSNNVCYPEISLGFLHSIHRTKDKMELTEKYANRKKIYLVTSLFEKNIDYKQETGDGVPFTSINDGTESFIKEIDPKLPPIMNRAYLKLWEMIVMFNLIPDIDNFSSAHLAEGPGSFIQATIYFRELQEKLGKIKTASKDNYYGVTIHSDHEHLHMHKEFIKFFDKEKSTRLHVLETKSIKEIKDMYGGFKSSIQSNTSNTPQFTNGDLTKINTIRIFGGSKDEAGFVKHPADLVTADGGFDWKKENLQEQEAYKLIFSEILTAIKVQKNGGNFVLKIFESYTTTTLKMIELLKEFYKEVYICKPYTSRISNSEKYLVCKNFNKSKATVSVIKKLEEFVITINKNEGFNIIDIFSTFELSKKNINEYKNINIQLMAKQYIGINNIVLFDNLDNKNGIEYNEFLDKQIDAATFWNDLFLNTSNYSKFRKYIESYDFFKLKHIIDEEENKKMEKAKEIRKDQTQAELGEKGIEAVENVVESEEMSEEEKPKKSKRNMSRSGSKSDSKNKPKTKSDSKTKPKKKVNRSEKNQRGGGDDDSDKFNIYKEDLKSIDSYDSDQIGKLDSDNDDDDFIDLGKKI